MTADLRLLLLLIAVCIESFRPLVALLDITQPSSNHAAPITVFAFLSDFSGGIAHFHEVCVMRENHLDGGGAVTGISADGARGTVIEQNQIRNCEHGGPRQISGAPIEDLMVRDNFYSNVVHGISLTSNSAVKRIIVEDNMIDLAPVMGTYGISLEGASTPPPAWSFDAVVIRGNRIRGLEGQAPVWPSNGITVTRANRLTIEHNIVDSPAGFPNDAIRVTDCVSMHVFNNRRINGGLAQVLNTNTGLFLHELTTDAEDALLSL